MESNEVNLIWALLRDKIFPPEVVPDEAACKAKLAELLDMRYPPQVVVDKFVEAVKYAPYSYIISIEKPEETTAAIKGSLGHDVYNVQPFAKKRSAHLIDIAGDLGRPASGRSRVSADPDAVVVPGPHPYAEGAVTIRSHACALPGSLLINRSPAERLLVSAFGLARLPRMSELMGPAPSLLDIVDASGRCLFVTLYTSDPALRARWAEQMAQDGAGGALAVHPQAVLAVFGAIPAAHRGSMAHYTILFLSYLYSKGYRLVIGECQALRQLAYWTRMGAAMVNPPAFDVRARLSSLAHTRRMSRLELCAQGILRAGELLAHDPLGSCRWNIFLPKPVYLCVDLGAAGARLGSMLTLMV